MIGEALAVVVVLLWLLEGIVVIWELIWLVVRISSNRYVQVAIIASVVHKSTLLWLKWLLEGLVLLML